MTDSNLRQAALFLLIGEALLAVMGGIIKHLSDHLPTEQIVFFRNIGGLAVLLPLILSQGTSLLKTQVWHLHLFRGLVGVSAMYCYFWALGNMPLAEAFLVKLSGPFFMPLIALLWLGERAGRYSIIAIIIGFAGVACILRPDNSAFTLIALVALLGAFLAAVAKVTIRRMSGTESSQTIVFYFGLIATIVTAPAAILNWQTPSLMVWLWIVAMSLVATIGQLALTRAYRIAPTGKVGVYVYSAVLYGALMGRIFWDEIPLWTTWLGAALIISAGLLNLYRPRSEVGSQKI